MCQEWERFLRMLLAALFIIAKSGSNSKDYGEENGKPGMEPWTTMQNGAQCHACTFMTHRKAV
jgi:hypothetical protein